MQKRTKIVATLGPASDRKKTLRKMIDAGMDVARLNFSHGTHEGHRATMKLVRDAAAKMKRPVAVLADMCGPKMRVGKFPDGPISLPSPGPRWSSVAAGLPFIRP